MVRSQAASRRRIPRDRGSLALPCSALILLVCLGGFGTWGLMRHWRQLMELQLRLDRCVGEKALLLRSLAGKADRSNQRLRWERRIAPTEAVLGRDGGAAAKAVILAEFALQESLAAAWKAIQVQWIAHGGCGSPGDRPLPLPGLDWRRPSPDEWGPQPFEWTRSEFRISVYHWPRAAAAKIIPEDSARGKGDRFGKARLWKAAWSRPGWSTGRTRPD